MKPRLVMFGVLLCLSSCADTMHGDRNDPVDVDEAMPPIGGHRANGTTVPGPAHASAAGHVHRLPRVDPEPDPPMEAYHPMPDAAAMQMISSGYDPSQAGDDDDSQNQEDPKHFVVPDTQVSYGKPHGGNAN
ncbi:MULTISPECIES: hypothetical protein [Novacetimonas]|uniref:hypothetical protein n=1 Tax=Novacetimonas TaxID=2919364 RepID=UPI0007928A37|nr:hypothetical protein [Novacetimonas hansenii]WEQ60183.1 hypothetical protein LV563_06740 [Novacetimonas hansenii]CUW46466.1 hypothetical protein ATCC53582_00560 [Novacetimonas hansenii]